MSDQQLEERAARLRQPGKPFRLGFFTQAPSPTERPARRTYEELVESIVAAEELGYDSVWIGQHHFSPEDGAVPSPLVVLANAAARTTRIHLATAVIALPFEHPIRLAEDLAVLDELAGGRVQVGLGGARGDLQAFNTFGIDFAARHEIFDRNLGILQHLLEGRTCTEFIAAPNIALADPGAPAPAGRLSASDSVAGQLATADLEPKRLFPAAPSLRNRLWQTASSEERARMIARNNNGLLIGAFHDHVIHHQLRFIVGYLEEWQALHGNLDEARIGAQRFTLHGESAAAIAESLGPDVAATQRGLADRFPQLGALTPAGYLASVARTGSSREIVQQLLEDPSLLGFITDFFPTTGLFPSVREGTAGADLNVERLRLFAEEIAPELGWKPATSQPHQETPMPDLEFIRQSSGLGYALLFGPGIVLLLTALAVKGAVRTTHNYVISGRLLGFGFGVASLISVWTWSMAVMLSSAQAYTWGTSGLIWFIVPNGLAVIIMVPFALKLRQKMPSGYTLAEFIRARFQNSISSVATLVFLIGALLGVIMINLAGLVLVMNKIFGLTPISIVITGIVVVTVYSYFGGLTTSAVTGTLNTLLLGVGSSVVVLFALAKAGGADLVFNEVQARGDQHLNPFNPVTAASFGLALALGLLTNVIADQSFWQRVWAIRPKDLGRSFLWAGVWFYPIPMALGLLGFIGVAYGVTPEQLGSLGAGAIGPHVIASLGLPVFIIALYTLVVVNACFAAIDGALSGVTSLVAVDIVHRYWPKVSERKLLTITKSSMIVAAAIAGGVVLTGIDYVNLVTTVYFYGTSLLIPVTLSIFWSRMTGTGYVAGVLAGVAVGGPLRETLGPTYGPLFGIIGLIAASAIVSIVVSLRANTRFDFDSLADGTGALLERDAAPTDSASDPTEPTDPAADGRVPAGQQ